MAISGNHSSKRIDENYYKRLLENLAFDPNKLTDYQQANYEKTSWLLRKADQQKEDQEAALSPLGLDTRILQIKKSGNIDDVFRLAKTRAEAAYKHSTEWRQLFGRKTTEIQTLAVNKVFEKLKQFKNANAKNEKVISAYPVELSLTDIINMAVNDVIYNRDSLQLTPHADRDGSTYHHQALDTERLSKPEVYAWIKNIAARYVLPQQYQQLATLTPNPQQLYLNYLEEKCRPLIESNSAFPIEQQVLDTIRRAQDNYGQEILDPLAEKTHQTLARLAAETAQNDDTDSINHSTRTHSSSAATSDSGTESTVLSDTPTEMPLSTDNNQDVQIAKQIEEAKREMLNSEYERYKKLIFKRLQTNTNASNSDIPGVISSVLIDPNNPFYSSEFNTYVLCAKLYFHHLLYEKSNTETTEQSLKMAFDHTKIYLKKLRDEFIGNLDECINNSEDNASKQKFENKKRKLKKQYQLIFGDDTQTDAKKSTALASDYQTLLGIQRSAWFHPSDPSDPRTYQAKGQQKIEHVFSLSAGMFSYKTSEEKVKNCFKSIKAAVFG